MLAAKMVARIATALAPEVRVMPVKGVLVSRRFYDDPAERAMSDCDLVLVGPLRARDAARRLVRDGWRVADWSNDPHVVDVAHPSAPGMHADLHSRPLPLGYGPVTAEWMAEGATLDRALFGVEVLVPDDRRLLVHLLGNIARDHLVNARPHTADDVARVLARSPYSTGDFARTVADARLRIASWSALRHVAKTRPDAPVLALIDALRLSDDERAYAQWRESVLATSSSARAPWRARLVARCASDDLRDAAVGAASAAYGVASVRVLRAIDRWRDRRG